MWIDNPQHKKRKITLSFKLYMLLKIKLKGQKCMCCIPSDTWCKCKVHLSFTGCHVGMWLWKALKQRLNLILHDPILFLDSPVIGTFPPHAERPPTEHTSAAIPTPAARRTGSASMHSSTSPLHSDHSLIL